MLPNAYMGRLYNNEIKIKIRIQIYKIVTVSKMTYPTIKLTSEQ